jgi:hypothetical protein
MADEPHPLSAADIATAHIPSALCHRPGQRADRRAPDTAPQHDVARAGGSHPRRRSNSRSGGTSDRTASLLSDRFMPALLRSIKIARR